MGLGDGVSILTEDLDVIADSFTDQCLRLLECVACGNASRQVRHVGAEAVARPFDDRDVACHKVPFSMPTCFVMLARIPGERSLLGLPAIVTVPGLCGW